MSIFNTFWLKDCIYRDLAEFGLHINPDSNSIIIKGWNEDQRIQYAIYSKNMLMYQISGDSTYLWGCQKAKEAFRRWLDDTVV